MNHFFARIVGGGYLAQCWQRRRVCVTMCALQSRCSMDWIKGGATTRPLLRFPNLDFYIHLKEWSILHLPKADADTHRAGNEKWRAKRVLFVAGFARNVRRCEFSIPPPPPSPRILRGGQISRSEGGMRNITTFPAANSKTAKVNVTTHWHRRERTSPKNIPAQLAQRDTERERESVRAFFHY